MERFVSNVSRKKYIPAESRVTRVLARTRPTMASPAASFDADAVAAYLLDRRHLLSAFELYQDLISPPATSTKAGERDVVRDGDADARAKLEAFFGDQKRFALSDVRAHADAVDGTPRQPSPPPCPESPLVSSPGRRDATGSNTRPESNTLPPTVPALRATVREQESRIKLAEYERRCAEEDLARLREERETRAVPAAPLRQDDLGENTHVEENAAIFERVDEAPRDDACTQSYAASDGFLNRAECVDLANVKPIPPIPSDITDEGTPTAPAATLPDITAGERRCLNLVTHQYLARRGYRAAALAMRQEATAGQELDDWSPLGGEPARGEALRLMLRRAKALETLDPAAFKNVLRERDESVRELGEVKTAKETLESELATATREVDAVRRELARARAEHEAAATEGERWRAKFDEAAATVRHVERAAQRARREAGESPGDDSPGSSAAGGSTALTKGSSALESAAEEEATVRALLESLPRVSPHTLVQHRAELLPLYARAATRARLPRERAAALAQMLSCVKRPGSEQRRAVAETCASIGAAMGEERCAAELMTSIAKNCAEHKAEERRLLGVECLVACAGVSGRVAGMVLEELTRIAAVEASATVRVAIVRAVESTLDATDDENLSLENNRGLRDSDVITSSSPESPNDDHKRDRSDPSSIGPSPAVADDALMSLALDSSDEVSNAAIERLAPALARWRRRLARRGVHSAGGAGGDAVPKFAAALEDALGEISRGGEDARWRVGTLSRALEALAIDGDDASPLGDASPGDASPGDEFAWVARCAAATARSEEGCVAAVARAIRAHCERAGPAISSRLILPAILAATGTRPRGDESAGLAVALAAAAPCAGEGAYERVVRELLCADPSTNDADDADDADDDDGADADTFARTSYAFEFASLFDGRHLAARTVASLRALIESSGTDSSPRVVGRAVASVGACASGLDAGVVLADVVPILSAVIDRKNHAPPHDHDHDTHDDDDDANLRREAARSLCACAESHADDDSVVDAAHDAIASFADGPAAGGVTTDRETVEAVAEMLGRAGTRGGFGRHRARAAATLARVASREAAAAAAAAGGSGGSGGEGGGGGGDFSDVGAALFASIRAVLSGGDDGNDGIALFETLAPALRRMLDVGDAMLDASDRALAEAMLRDGDGGGASSSPGESPATPPPPAGASEAPPSTSGKKKKKKSMLSYAYGGVRKHALGLPSRDPEKRAAAAGSANEKENGAGGGGTETDATGGSPAVPTVSIDQLLG